MYRPAANSAVGVRKRSVAIPAVGKQHTDDAIDKACSDIGDVVHSPVKARESDQQRVMRQRNTVIRRSHTRRMWSARKAKAR